MRMKCKHARKVFRDVFLKYPLELFKIKQRLNVFLYKFNVGFPPSNRILKDRYNEKGNQNVIIKINC